MMLYCPSCDEECEASSSSSMCLTCGDELQTPASNNSTSSARDRNNETARGLAQLLANTMNTNNNDDGVAALLPLMRQSAQNGDISDIQDILPPEALNPQSGTARHRPVSEKVLNGLKRTVLTPQSAELFEAQVSVYPSIQISDLSSSMEGEKITFNAVPGEFAMQFKNDEQKKRCNAKTAAALVICSPRTTKGGLSSETLAEIAQLRQHRIPFIAYVERGDGITFVQKALTCQNAGRLENNTDASLCIGVIVGNTTSGGAEIWPYQMQDNRNEAKQGGLAVPVVMIRRDDGARLVKFASQTTESGKMGANYTPCQIKIHSKEAHSCPVCTDSFEPGATIIRLSCGHVFHEFCATAWLTKHNTCPSCRKELPTDDEEYEMERRRRETSEANSGDVGSSTSANNFYG